MIPIIVPFLGDEESEAAAAAIKSGWVAQGPRVAEFESSFAATVGAHDAVAVSSATAGLHLAMIALGIGPGDEVVVPSLSFIASANAPRYVGATPVFADVDPSTFSLTAASIEEVITTRTRAVIVVHQLGMPADLDAIRALCDRRGVAIVEDAACAIGSTYRGSPIGGHSDLVVFSLHPRKLLTTGEGGMITVGDEAMAARLRRLRQHGMNVAAYERDQAQQSIVEEYVELGFNYRLTDIQAAIGLVQLRRLDELVERRRDRAADYAKAFAAVPGVTVPSDPPYGTTNYQSYSLRIGAGATADRDEVIEALLAQDIASKPALRAAHHEPAFQGHPHGPLPVTDQIHRDGLLLPLFHEMTDEQQRRVVDAVSSAVIGGA